MKGLMELGGEVCSDLIPHVATHCSHPFGRYSFTVQVICQDFSDGLQELCAINDAVQQALTNFEQAFPRSEFAIMMYLAGHLPAQISLFGPLRSMWLSHLRPTWVSS
jgi:hypothetical protein